MSWPCSQLSVGLTLRQNGAKFIDCSAGTRSCPLHTCLISNIKTFCTISRHSTRLGSSALHTRSSPRQSIPCGANRFHPFGTFDHGLRPVIDQGCLCWENCGESTFKSLWNAINSPDSDGTWYRQSHWNTLANLEPRISLHIGPQRSRIVCFRFLVFMIVCIEYLPCCYGYDVLSIAVSTISRWICWITRAPEFTLSGLLSPKLSIPNSVHLPHKERSPSRKFKK